MESGLEKRAKNRRRRRMEEVERRERGVSSCWEWIRLR